MNNLSIINRNNKIMLMLGEREYAYLAEDCFVSEDIITQTITSRSKVSLTNTLAFVNQYKGTELYEELIGWAYFSNFFGSLGYKLQLMECLSDPTFLVLDAYLNNVIRTNEGLPETFKFSTKHYVDSVLKFESSLRDYTQAEYNSMYLIRDKSTLAKLLFTDNEIGIQVFKNGTHVIMFKVVFPDDFVTFEDLKYFPDFQTSIFTMLLSYVGIFAGRVSSSQLHSIGYEPIPLLPGVTVTGTDSIYEKVKSVYEAVKSVYKEVPI